MTLLRTELLNTVENPFCLGPMINYFSTSVLTVNAGVVKAALPETNLQTGNLGEVARLETAVNVELDVALPAALTDSRTPDVGCVGILGIKGARRAMSFKVKQSSTGYDSGFISFPATLDFSNNRMPLNLYWINPNGSIFDPLDDFQIEFDDSTSTVGYFDVGAVVAGPFFQPRINHSWGIATKNFERTKRTGTLSGMIFADANPATRKFTFQLRGMDKDELFDMRSEVLFPLTDGRGIIYWRDPDSPSEFFHINVYGTAFNTSDTFAMFDWIDFQFQFDEIRND